MKAYKITTENYFKVIAKIGFEKLPKALQDSHMVIITKTNEGKNWNALKSDKDLANMSNLAFTKLEDFIRSENKEELSGTPKENPITLAEQSAA